MQDIDTASRMASMIEGLQAVSKIAGYGAERGDCIRYE